MAERRMFAKSIIDSDAFLDMPVSAQALYFHLSMRADDEGFVGNPRKILRVVGSSEDDMKILIAKRFLITFDSGIVVIKHWRIHNYIQSDRFKPTLYTDEKEQIYLKSNKSYSEVDETLENAECIQDGYKLDTQSSLDKSSLGQSSLGQSSLGQSMYTVTEHLSDEEWTELQDTYEDLAMMINLVDDLINARSERTEIRNPYRYIRQVAEEKGWKKKR